MPRLRALRLLSPQIVGTGLGHLAKLPDLRELTLGRAVRDISAVPKFPSLRLISLSGAAINDDALSPLSRCHSLEIPALDKTAVTNQGIIHLAGLTRLHTLQLNDTQFGDAGLGALLKCPQLRELNLDRTRLSNAGLAELGKFPLLEALSLHGMPLNEEGIQNLMQLKQLKSLSVSYARESFPDNSSQLEAQRLLLDRLREALPGREID